jgi:3-phenylpropionate/cinnamic acid dioxygenase small subunit
MTTAIRKPSVDQQLWNELMHFYIGEAWLLDERRLNEWLELFTDDLIYFMPRRKNVLRRDIERELTKPGDMAFFEDTMEMMRVRVMRLETGMAWAEDPPSRTRHLIGNLVVGPTENGEIRTKTGFIVYKSHLETDTDIYAGYREDVLRQVDGEWKISKRTVVLDANVLLSKNISIFF